MSAAAFRPVRRLWRLLRTRFNGCDSAQGTEVADPPMLATPGYEACAGDGRGIVRWSRNSKAAALR